MRLYHHLLCSTRGRSFVSELYVRTLGVTGLSRVRPSSKIIIMLSSNSISRQRIWFSLLDSASEQPFGGCTADFVSLPHGSHVAQFRDAVHTKNVSILNGIVPSQLLVYKNTVDFVWRNSTVKDGEDYDNGSLEEQPALHPTQSIQGLGSMEDMLVVVVPSSSRNTSSLPIVPDSTKESSWDRVEPRLKRKQRWAEINKVLEGNVKKPKANNEDPPDSSICWEQVKSIFQLTKYVQSQRVMDDAQIDFLKKYLRCTTKCFGPVSLGKEANRLHFIAPFLVSVCMLLGGDDVRISVEENSLESVSMRVVVLNS